ncbi:MAG TPA: glycosyltransferase family 2 protein [Planctomycetaceae bacterium]|nr:glycosyltransferase family 2 protein [Planctomycetaceae bacterium]
MTASDCGAVDLSRVAVIIPALNEEASLPLVLKDIPPVGRVIVVDNGSSDRTAEVAAAAGAMVAREPRRGYGAACLRGLAALGVCNGEIEHAAQVVVFLDGDYSDDPRALLQLVRPICDGVADFVLGSRLVGRREPGAMPPQSVFGNRLACFLMRVLLGARYTDLGPFRAIGYQSLCKLKMSDRDFGWTIEMQIKAARMGLRTQEIPVVYRRRIGKSKISGTVWGSVRAGYKILLVIAKYGWLRRSP